MFNNFYVKLGNVYAFKIPGSYHSINLSIDFYIKGLHMAFLKKRIFKKTTSIMFFCIKIYGKAIIPKGFLRVIKVL